MAKYALGVLLIVHGIAHLVGFLVPWRIGHLEGAVYRTTLLGGAIDIGDSGARIVGLLWLGTAVLVAAAGVAVLAAYGSWRALTTTALIVSLVLSVLGWPDSRIGVAVNVALLAWLGLASALNWTIVPAPR
jgi:hypothetical protein